MCFALSIMSYTPLRFGIVTAVTTSVAVVAVVVVVVVVAAAVALSVVLIWKGNKTGEFDSYIVIVIFAGTDFI